MPIYEYECTTCHKRLEILQKVSDPPLENCPHCKGSVEKVVSAAGLQFKGSGWYITDYAKKNGKASSSAREEKKTEGSSASESSTPSEGSTKKDPPPTQASKKEKD